MGMYCSLGTFMFEMHSWYGPLVLTMDFLKVFNGTWSVESAINGDESWFRGSDYECVCLAKGPLLFSNCRV